MAQNPSNNNTPGDGWEIDDNFDDVQTRRDIQPGRWLMRVASMEKKATKAGDKDYFNVCFEVIDVLKAEDEEVIGAKAWDIFNINQAALWKLKALISACGYDSTGSRVPNLVDCEVIVDTYEEEYQGDRRLKTKRYKNPVKEGWVGVHESRDATDDGKGKSGEKADAGKKLPPSGAKKNAGKKAGDDEIEI